MIIRPIDLVLPSTSDVASALTSFSLVNAKDESYVVIDVEETSVVVADDTFSVTLSVDVAVTDDSDMETALRTTFIEANG